MLAKAMIQMKTDPAGAIGTLATHPQGKDLMPLVMQEYQRQQWMKALQGGQTAQQPPQTDAEATLAQGHLRIHV